MNLENSISRNSIIEMELTGSKQGPFKSDKSRAGDNACLVVGYRFGIAVPHGTRSTTGGGLGVPQNGLTWIICQIKAFVAQCLTAVWGESEPLDVVLRVKRNDKSGKPETYMTVQLSKATIARLEFGVGAVEILLDKDTRCIADDDYGGIVAIGFVGEKINFDIEGSKAEFKQKAAGS
ncbi:hypothetical protein LZC95_08220 [Pendulispora brunnea]|uniref:Type VI secretion system tube protein Hcp n=1 Tax=Pendulispora brunnea TaxID=2905690 RepID=A0ABZ2KDZ2_9BACT